MYSEWTLKYDEPEMSNFKAKMHRIRFRSGLRPRSRLGSLQRSPDPLDEFKGAYF